MTYFVQRLGPDFRRVGALMRRDDRGNAQRWIAKNRVWINIDPMTLLDAERNGDPTLDKITETAAQELIATSL